MKRTITAAVLVLFGLWFGYALGYHQGVRNEQKAWASTYTLDSNGRPIYNTWPGSNSRRGLRFQHMVNSPDPRDSLVK